MQRARILMLCDSPYVGGVSSHVLSVLEAFGDDARFEFVLATFPGRRTDEFLLDRAKQLGISAHTFPMAWTFDLRVIGAVRNFIEENEIDLIHLHDYRAALICRFAAPNTPTVNTCHGILVAPTLRLRLWQWAKLRAMRTHKRTIACSNFVRNWLIKKGLAPETIQTVYNTSSPVNSGRSEVPLRANIDPNATIVLYVGRLVRGKGIEVLLDALATVQEIAAVIVGDGPLRSYLEMKAKMHEGDVYFAGRVTDPGPYYARADVVVLPSRMEAFPITLVEAAAHGKPVIATNVGGVPEVVRHGETGLLVEFGNVAELKHALEHMRDPEERRKMGEAARRAWETRFSPAHLVEAIAKTYQEVLNA